MNPTTTPPSQPDDATSPEVDDQSAAKRGRLSTLMQRLFYPDEHEKEQILLDLIEDLGRCRDVAELARDVGQGLDQALQPRRLHLFARHERRFRLVWSTDQPLEPLMLIPDSFRLLTDAAHRTEPTPLESIPSLSPEERQWFRSLGTAWVTPLVHTDPKHGLVGLALLGERNEGYSAVQRDLLQTLASRMARRVSELVLQHQRQLLAEQGRGTWLKECSLCHRCFDTTTCFCPEDDAVLEPTILLDRLVDGRYLLEQRLGSGGMGSVYQATDQTTGRAVAVKILTGGDDTALRRFETEAKAGQVIRHPNITQVIDSGHLGRQGAFMVMEFVEGRTLREVMDADMPIAPHRAARWFDQILSGVAAAHADRVIHRDLKPDNIMIVDGDGEETLKVLDFGLAKIASGSTQSQPALTAVGMVIGTLSYMSPEQLAADRVDHRADQFALGAMASEALTGKLPFYAENLGTMLRAVANQPFRMEVTTANQARVADILGRALAKSPDDRYTDVESFRRDLVPALEACEAFG